MDIAKLIVLIIDDEYRSFRSLLRLISPDWFSVTWGLPSTGKADFPSGGNNDHGTIGTILVLGGHFL